MAKEFDIFLKNRLTQCDIIVYSIPFRDGLTAAHRIILESCLESYMLQKFVAMQTGSRLVSHIDKMIKTCIERLHVGAEVDASVKFQTHYVLNPTPSVAEIALPESMDTLRTLFSSADSRLQMTIAPLNARIAKSLGGGGSKIISDIAVRDAIKQSLLRPVSETQLLSQIGYIQAGKTIPAESKALLTADIANLCYRLYTASETLLQLAANVLGTEIHFSFGNGSTWFEITCETFEECATKYETAENPVSLLSELAERIAKYMVPELNGVQFAAEAAVVLMRHRLLAELDEDTLLSYDDMALDEIDYVIL